MPCRDDGYPSDAEVCRDTLNKQQKKLDKVTRLLCEVLTAHEQAQLPFGDGKLFAVSDECWSWFKAHKEADKKRIAAEEKAKQEDKKRLLDRAEKLKNELAKITKELDKHK